MNNGSGTAPPYRRDESWRLALWLALVAIFIALQYIGRASGTASKSEPLYHWSFAALGLIQEGFILLIVLAIAGFSRELLALRRPRSIRTALGLLGIALVVVYAFEIAYSGLVHPGNEQGLTPSHWEPRHALAYVVNGIVICTAVPFVEEVTFRGLGYSLLERFGRWPAIASTGVLFGLSHGLVLELPIIATFGCVLAWIRARTDSVYPGMVLHGAFNLIALVLAVTIGG